jgi:hypothetical protein
LELGFDTAFDLVATPFGTRFDLVDTRFHTRFHTHFGLVVAVDTPFGTPF